MFDLNLYTFYITLPLWLRHFTVTASMRRPFRVGACQLGIRALGLDNPVSPSVFKLLSSYVRNMPPRKEPRTPVENNFPGFEQFGEAIANAIQSALRPPQRNILDFVARLKIDELFGT